MDVQSYISNIETSRKAANGANKRPALASKCEGVKTGPVDPVKIIQGLRKNHLKYWYHRRGGLEASRLGSVAFFENEVTKPKRGQTIPGIVICLTPEILSGEEIDPSKIDSFGMGVAFYILLTRGNYHPLLPIPEEEAKKSPPFN